VARFYLRTCQERLETAKQKIEVRPEGPAVAAEPAEPAEDRDTLL